MDESIKFEFDSKQFTVNPDNKYRCSEYIWTKGFNPLMYLVMNARTLNNDSEMNKYILEHKEQLNQKNAYGHTPLILACRNSNTYSTESTVNMLINAGCELDIQDITGTTALIYAVTNRSKNSSEDTVNMLVNAGCDLDKLDDYSRTALMMATYDSKLSKDNTLQILVNAGANLNIRSSCGKTTLMFACRNLNSFSTTNTIKILLDSNVDLKLANKGKSGFMYVCKYSDTSLVKYCFDKHIYYNEIELLKCIELGKHRKLLVSYLADLYFKKVNWMKIR